MSTNPLQYLVKEAEELRNRAAMCTGWAQDVWFYGLCGNDDCDMYSMSIEGHDYSLKVWEIAQRQYERDGHI